MNKPSIEDILTPKPAARPRIYAYAINDAAHAGLLKVGQTTREVRQRVAGGESELGRQLAIALAEWFDGHAATMDAMLAAWMLERGHEKVRAAEPAQA